MTVDPTAFARTLEQTRAALLSQWNPGGFWYGRLSSSALSTATATVALALVDAQTHRSRICSALDWLAAHANADGGWGDTTHSRSNINTTCLCWAALAFAPEDRSSWNSAADAGQRWIASHVGALSAQALTQTILRFYGDDRTFSTPVLTLLALSGRLGPRQQAFGNIPALPFELAAAPQSMWRLLRLPVVSYALPALVAIGQARHHHAPSRYAPLRWLRELLRGRTLQVVQRMQPSSGGFLEAIPLTSFVCSCLAAMGLRDHPMTRDCVRFLVGQIREDNALPIDTCLSTWLTGLSVHALSINGQQWLAPQQRQSIIQWLVKQQYAYVHPFTNTPPGGWSWMNTDGAVPDADDTPATILALMALGADQPAVRSAIERGVQWLLKLQNRNGGIPTFCRGWGKLPFDRSAADISAHTLRAWRRATPLLPAELSQRVAKAGQRLVAYLDRMQQPDGSWLPLWFGNQYGPDDTNPCYGTARVLKGLADCGLSQRSQTLAAVRWLIQNRKCDGGWSGGSGPASVEETAVAVEGLASWLRQRPSATEASAAQCAMADGVNWLIHHTGQGTHFPTAPIGLYFAKLWYSEDLYPLVFGLAALESAAACGGLG